MPREIGMKSLRIVLCSLALALPVSAANAEFSVGIGALEKPTRDASAALNEAFSTLHLLLAALDRNDVGKAYDYKDRLVRELSKAHNMYEAARREANGKVIVPRPRTAEERADVAFFDVHAKSHGLAGLISDKDLLTATANFVDAFSILVEKADLKSIANDVHQHQRFFRSALDL